MSDKPYSSSSGISTVGQIARFLGKLWVIVTAVLGSLLIVSIIGIGVAIRHGVSPDMISPPPTQKVIKKAGAAKIAVVHLDGIIGEDDQHGIGAAGSSVSSTRVNHLLDQIADDVDVKAVVLRINSPGGAVVASDEIYRRVEALQKKKIVIANMGDVAASGGYYIAVGANKIVANPATITGSIGVIAQFPKLSGLYTKLGVEMRTFKSGQFKDIGSESRDLTNEEKQILNGIITASYDQFVTTVSKGRHMDEQKVRQLADGRIYVGTQAKELGLVDELGDIETAYAMAKDLAHLDNPSIVEYSDHSFFDSLLNSKAGSITLGASLDHLLPTRFGMYYLWSTE